MMQGTGHAPVAVVNYSYVQAKQEKPPGLSTYGIPSSINDL